MLCQLPKCHNVGVSVSEPSHLRVTCATTQTRHHPPTPKGPSLVPFAFSEVTPNVSTLHRLRRTVLSKSSTGRFPWAGCCQKRPHHTVLTDREGVSQCSHLVQHSDPDCFFYYIIIVRVMCAVGVIMPQSARGGQRATCKS